MIYFSRLPAELVLLVARHAARDHALRSASWVATLCLVCRSFRRVVTPLLYDLITVDSVTLDRLAATSKLPDTPLLRTRSLVVASTYTSYIIKPESFASLARALRNITSFTGSTESLSRIACSVDELRLRSAYLVDPTFLGGKSAIAAIQPVITTLSRLHIVHEIGRPPSMSPKALLGSFQVEYLIIDVFERKGEHVDDSDMDISRDISHWVASAPCLRRVLFRARCVNERTACRALRHVAEWAERERDARIWVDDTFVPNPSDDDDDDDDDADAEMTQWDNLDWEDAVAGDCLWLQGHRVWHPASDGLD
ncbi:hypothetical protein EXIGLDRAFT_837890 [Exidia glandulosa HHB12029]|uniref:Uncharacterized protein n=1 Tax=Exidia glandulosa HHB12029 TaxID=1314781 RepID=A0A165GBU6_EXIGL|nr:hypothetical protein EXIGLDRAFT_837890 [Exidia glandulosa HHB12029]